MPKFSDLVGATEKCPVLTYQGNITLVEKSSAFRVAANHHGLRRAEVHIGKPVWVLPGDRRLRAAKKS